MRKSKAKVKKRPLVVSDGQTFRGRTAVNDFTRAVVALRPLKRGLL